MTKIRRNGIAQAMRQHRFVMAGLDPGIHVPKEEDGRVKPGHDDVSSQDALDVLAVAAGLKPLAIVMADDAAAGALAARHGLCVARLAPWGPAGALPDWYAAARRAWRARQPLLCVARDRSTLACAAALSGRGFASPEEEAAILGYPLCCVAAQQAKTLALEALVAAMTDRAAGGDPVRRARMIEAGAAPLPLGADEAARFAALARVTPSRWASVNLCALCAADPRSPAMLLDAAYAALARRDGD